ncbi:beta-lactamase family protein [Microcoleus sp. FACHB-672]|nr:beta-lactamase family protein [Microcoleus sp. FACHB-672]
MKNFFVWNQPDRPWKVKEENTSNPYSNDLAIDRAVQREMGKQKLYGLAIGIVKDGEIIYLKGYGYEDFENKVPVEAHKTMFRWASLSKSVTGVAAMQAVSTGTLDLDTEVRNYVPEYQFPNSYASPLKNGKFQIQALPNLDKSCITTRMLLTHTSGIKDFSNGLNEAGVPPDHLINDPNVNTGIFWAGEYFWNDPDHLLYIPGTQYSYSVYGYTLAGMVIERAGTESQSYWEKVRDKIAVPFGMTPASFPKHPEAGYLSETCFQPDWEWVNIPRRAIGYNYNKKTRKYARVESKDVSWRLPAGGFISTIENLAQYCNGLMNREDVLPAQIKQDILWKGSQYRDGKSMKQSMGFSVGEFKGRKRIIGAGAQPKTRTRFIIYPDERLGFVAMSNSEWANVDKICEVLENAYRKNK